LKTYKNLYPQIYCFANLYQAFRAARKGKRNKVEVASFEFDLEHNLLALEAELRDQTYRPGGYTNFYIYEPKWRLVSAAPFRDRIVHHALCMKKSLQCLLPAAVGAVLRSHRSLRVTFPVDSQSTTSI
jgi:RNA-directed DNA polymerase